jgi:hypothetical protein
MGKFKNIYIGEIGGLRFWVSFFCLKAKRRAHLKQSVVRCILPNHDAARSFSLASIQLAAHYASLINAPYKMTP